MNDLAENAIEKIQLVGKEKKDLASEILQLRKTLKDANTLLTDKEIELRKITEAKKEAERLELKKSEALIIEKSRLEAEMLKYKSDIEKLKRELKQQEKNILIIAAKELEKLNKKHAPKSCIGEFRVETHVTSDRRIRFSAPPKIKEKLKAGQKVRLEVKIFSKHPNSAHSTAP